MNCESRPTRFWAREIVRWRCAQDGRGRHRRIDQRRNGSRGAGGRPHMAARRPARRVGGDMIAAPSTVKALVATKPVDFRKGAGRCLRSTNWIKWLAKPRRCGGKSARSAPLMRVAVEEPEVEAFSERLPARFPARDVALGILAEHNRLGAYRHFGGTLGYAFWRKGWDSNPRYPCGHAGFQDRCLKPLGHPSIRRNRRVSQIRQRTRNRPMLSRVYPT